MASFSSFTLAGVEEDLHGRPLFCPRAARSPGGRPSESPSPGSQSTARRRAAATGVRPATPRRRRLAAGSGTRLVAATGGLWQQQPAVSAIPPVDRDTGAPYHDVSTELRSPSRPRGDAMPPDQLTAEPTELLRTMIRNACVNDDTVGSGQEIRNVAALEDYFAGSGLTCRRFEAAPGRASLVARIEGRDRTAPTLLLMGHTDVVPANPAGWRRDPFGGELVDGIVWGRGATDMLNLTATMAVATRRLAVAGFRPRGTLDLPGGGRRGGGRALRRAAPHEARARRGPRGLRHHGERRRAGPDAGGPGAPAHGRREGRQLAPDRRPGHARARLAAVPLRQRARDRRRGRAADRRLPAEGAHPRRLAALRGGRPARPGARRRADGPGARAGRRRSAWRASASPRWPTRPPTPRSRRTWCGAAAR